MLGTKQSQSNPRGTPVFLAAQPNATYFLVARSKSIFNRHRK